MRRLRATLSPKGGEGCKFNSTRLSVAILATSSGDAAFHDGLLPFAYGFSFAAPLPCATCRGIPHGVPYGFG